jgi:hypothetical protein
MPPKTTSAIMELTGMITSLLNHYWTADDLLASREAQLADWLEDLSRFDLSIVRDALAEWRRKPGSRRPTPGDIYAICFADQQDHHRLLENKTKAQTWEPWLYELWGPAATGQPARQAAIAAQEARYQRAEQWRKAGSIPSQSPKDQAAE